MENREFLTVPAANNVQINVLMGKNIKIAVTTAINITLNEARDGDNGIIILVQDATGHPVSLNGQFNIPVGEGQISGAASAVSTVKWVMVGTDIIYEVGVTQGAIEKRNQTYVISRAGAKVGSAAGFVVAVADDKSLITCPASQTAAKLVIPVNIPLKVGSIITGFGLVGQVESAGNHVTIAAELRKMTAAAADVADAKIADQDTAFDVVADTIISSANVGGSGLSEVVAADESYYILVTATTNAATDIALQGATLTISEL